MNPYTPVKRLALIHSTGTGKTRKGLLAAMQYNRDITVVVVHNNQSKPFMAELATGSVVDTVYPQFNRRVDILTCRSIITAVTKGDKQRLDYYFSNRVIVVDEMHHLRSRGDKKRSHMPMFDTLVNVLVSYGDSVVLFLTATPLVDSVSELIGVYTLLKGRAPPVSNYELLMHSLRGYISALDKRNLIMEYEDVECRMTEEGRQWELYKKHQSDRSSVYSKTSAISRFITNDDADATELIRPTSNIIEEALQHRIFRSYAEYQNACLEVLRHISIKAYMLIKTIKNNRGHPHFVFDTWKKRGGIDRILDILTMPVVGYISITNEQEALDTTRGPKVLALHRVNPSTLSKLLDIFNSYENRDGSLIEILLATPKFSESMSIRTAKYNHVYTCTWNVPSRKQIDGRTNRRSSLWYEEEKDRRIKSFSYILYKPDGGETVESEIRRQADMKYSEILPVLNIMKNVRLEQHYSPTSDRMGPMYPHNTRINNSMRMYTPTISYRDINMNIEQFLSMLERHQDLYTLIGSSVTSEEGQNRFMSEVVHTAESLYKKRLSGDTLSTKQNKMLDDLSLAFMEHDGVRIHVLYFANSDTAEYQRMNSIIRRVVRGLDESNNWYDIADRDTIRVVSKMYLNRTDELVDSIKSGWEKYGYYVTKCIVSSCYRLVEYKDVATISRAGHIHDVDHRRLSRGEKWQYYNKKILMAFLCKLIEQKAPIHPNMYKNYTTSHIFSAILQLARSKGMVITLPM
jgi:hypothetical protein